MSVCWEGSFLHYIIRDIIGNFGSKKKNIDRVPDCCYTVDPFVSSSYGLVTLYSKRSKGAARTKTNTATALTLTSTLWSSAILEETDGSRLAILRSRYSLHTSDESEARPLTRNIDHLTERVVREAHVPKLNHRIALDRGLTPYTFLPRRCSSISRKQEDRGEYVCSRFVSDYNF